MLQKMADWKDSRLWLFIYFRDTMYHSKDYILLLRDLGLPGHARSCLILPSSSPRPENARAAIQKQFHPSNTLHTSRRCLYSLSMPIVLAMRWVMKSLAGPSCRLRAWDLATKIPAVMFFCHPINNHLFISMLLAYMPVCSFSRHLTFNASLVVNAIGAHSLQQFILFR